MNCYLEPKLQVQTVYHHFSEIRYLGNIDVAAEVSLALGGIQGLHYK